MTAPVLDLDDHLVGREGELAELDASLERAERHGSECVLVSGAPGIGKSALLHSFGATVRRRDGLFAYGRYQEGTRAPYSAIGEAFGALVRGMESVGPGERDRWRRDLDDGTTATAGVLAALVPDLGATHGAAPPVDDLDAADSRRRLQRAATHLVAVTASYRPVVLAVDDLQWADRDSVLLLSELLAAAVRNVVLVGAHRSGQFRPSALDPGAAVRTVELDPLSAVDLDGLLAHVCGRSAELGEVVTQFRRRTGGNPLQVRQLLRRAEREGALRRPAADGHPGWDLRALAAIEVGRDATEFLGRIVDQLRPPDRAVLAALACIGQEFDLADAAAAAAEPTERVTRTLVAALDLRLVEAVDAGGLRVARPGDPAARYRFSHDRVAETVRARLTDDARREVHLRLGRWLVLLGEPRLFEAAGHLGVGGLAGNGDDRTRFAWVERRAAERARQRASFPVALACYRAGLALLGADRWTTQPELARELQLGAAEAAYLVADAALLETLVDEASRELDDPADRARLAFLRLKQQVAEHRLADALRTGLAALRELGVALPHRAGTAQAVAALVVLKARMSRWSDERLLALPPCTDRRVGEAQRILGELRSVAYMVAPELFPLVVRREVELTLAHGLAPASPTALVSYGVLLAVTGDYTGCQRFGEVALLLADRPGFDDARPQVRFLHLHFIRPWQRPIAEAVPQLQAAVREALDRGDLEYAGFLAVTLLYQSLWAGRPYPEVDGLAQGLIPAIRSQQVPSSMCRAIQQLCLNVMGRSDDPLLLAGESGYDERAAVATASRAEDISAQSVAAILKLGLHFWCGDYAGAIPVAEEVARHLDAQRGTPNLQLYHLTNALCRMHARPAERATARAVRRALDLHRRWAAVAPGNYGAHHELLEGAWARVRGDLRRAEHRLDRAVALAEEHRILQISALAHEELGAVRAQAGQEPGSRQMVRAAHERWLRLGMLVRSERLERAHPWLAGRELVPSRSSGVDPVGLHHLVQALATASSFGGLVEVLLGTVTTTTGAARALLLLGEGDRFEVRGVHAVGITTVVDGPHLDGADLGHDRSVVQELVRGDRPLARSERAGGTALAVPVRVRGRMIGAVYVEYPEADHVVRPVEEEALVALCAQAAGPLRNVELQERMLEAEEHQQSLMQVRPRSVPAELLRILDADEVPRIRRGERVQREMTVLLAEIRGRTALIEGANAVAAGELTAGAVRAVQMPVIGGHGLLQDLRGDEALAVFDADPDDAVTAGLAVLRSLREHNRERLGHGAAALRVGLGVDTGAVALGLTGGVNRVALDVVGDAVNRASRVARTTKRYGSDLLIDSATHDRLVHADRFALRRMERVAAIDPRRPVTIYEVYDEDPEPRRAAKRAAQPAFDDAFAWFDGGNLDRARAAFERCRTLLPDDPVAPRHLVLCDALHRGEPVAGHPPAP